jgi:hypothetical protein
MRLKLPNGQRVLVLLLTCIGALLPLHIRAASCKTQSQMTSAQRDALSNAGRAVAENLQSGDVHTLQANTIPAVAADFAGIADSANTLKPLVQGAAITIDSLYLLDASAEPAGAPRTDFYCGTPVVVLNFNSLPAGMYALVILHATGVPQPQQIALILSPTPEGRWMLAGFFSKPMTQAGHDGLWYWTSARKYAERKMNWDAWFYYRTAAFFLDPVEFMSSPNLEKLQHEQEKVQPDTLPGTKPLVLDAHGSNFQVTSIDTSASLGALDLDVYYAPDDAQAARLRDPPSARKQVTDLMTALLTLHPELQEAFHGMWIHAQKGDATLFLLELPMDQVVSGMQSPVASLNSGAH